LEMCFIKYFLLTVQHGCWYSDILNHVCNIAEEAGMKGAIVVGDPLDPNELSHMVERGVWGLLGLAVVSPLAAGECLRAVSRTSEPLHPSPRTALVRSLVRSFVVSSSLVPRVKSSRLSPKSARQEMRYASSSARQVARILRQKWRNSRSRAQSRRVPPRLPQVGRRSVPIHQ
jgi:hypothetical protein